MMDELIQRAETLRASLQDRLHSVFTSDIVQGATLEVDRYWLAWDLTRFQNGTKVETDEPSSEKLWRYWGQTFLYDAQRFEWGFDNNKVRPGDWNDYCKTMGYGEQASPILIRIILRRPLHTSDLLGELPRSFEGHPLLYEFRPPAVATGFLHDIIMATGFRWGNHQPQVISVGRAKPRTSGTLGGFLICLATGRIYLVSCAHVLGMVGPYPEVYTPGPHEDRDSKPIGAVCFARVPPPKLPYDDYCNLAAIPSAGRLDVAVAEWTPDSEVARRIDPKPSAYILRNCAQMFPSQPVSFVGKESGSVSAQLSAVTLWHEFEFKDFGDGPSTSSRRCFGTLFEMCGVAGDQYDLAQEGDSGAWVFDELGAARRWNGMLIARQGKRAYGCYAEYIMQELNNCADFPGGLAMQW